MKEKNQIKFNGIDLRIKFRSVDYLGNKWAEETYEENFSNLKINNVYKEFFEGNTPFPNSHWLEFTCITQENSKLFDSNLRNANLFKKNTKDPQASTDQVQAAFKALFTSVPVETIEVEIRSDLKGETRSEFSTFSILIDGKIFHNIRKVSVEPVTTKRSDGQSENKGHENSHIFLSVPIMTFLPLKL